MYIAGGQSLQPKHFSPANKPYENEADIYCS